MWKTDGPIRAMPWSPYVPDSAKKVADWTYPNVCGNCTEPKFKSGPVAAALRHIAPRLLEGLRDTRHPAKRSTDQEFTSIRIEVQVEVPVRKRQVVSRGEVPREKLSKVARGLADSPLKETLERMAEPQIISRTRSKT